MNKIIEKFYLNAAGVIFSFIAAAFNTNFLQIIFDINIYIHIQKS